MAPSFKFLLRIHAVLLLAPTGGLPAADASAAKPNVLLIISDDFRDEGGVFTRAQVKLPNLDRLTARGLRFERAYVQYTVCNPSRSSFLSGLRPEQTGIVDNKTLLRSRMPNVVTLPQLFKEGGWHTEAFGKIFHLGGAKGEANAEAGGTGAQWMDLPKSWDAATAFSATKAGRTVEGRNLTAGALAWCQWGMAGGGDDDQPDGQTAAAVTRLIGQQGANPWFIGCGFLKPHDPFIAPRKYFDLYPPESLKLWLDPPDMTGAPENAMPAPMLAEFKKFTDRERLEFLRAYCAAASFMDAQLGRVLDALDRGKLWDKTIVVFIGDHGYHTGERQWWNKNTLFERSCRAPLVIAAPGVKGGQVCRSIVEFVDLFPTLAESCGLTVPAGLAGTSLRPLLADPARPVKDAAFTLVTRGPLTYGRSVRTERWRFTQWSDGAQELYDHDADAEENHNVAPANPDVVGNLSARLKTLPPYPPKP
jgi:iduronate 2-sulfatase